MSKLGAIQDLAHGVEKIVGKSKSSQTGLGQREKDLLESLEKGQKRKKIFTKVFILLAITAITAIISVSLCFVISNTIVSICAGGDHTIGIKRNGTVVAVGNNENGQCNVENWTDIISVSASTNHTVGLKKDGTLVPLIEAGREITEPVLVDLELTKEDETDSNS